MMLVRGYQSRDVKAGMSERGCQSGDVRAKMVKRAQVAPRVIRVNSTNIELDRLASGGRT